MTQVALSSDHLFKKADTEDAVVTERRWSSAVRGVTPTVTLAVSEAQKRVAASLVRHVQTDAKRLHVQVGGSCLGLTGEGAVLGGVPASLQRRAGDSRCQVRAKPPQRRLVSRDQAWGPPIPRAQLRKDQ